MLCEMSAYMLLCAVGRLVDVNVLLMSESEHFGGVVWDCESWNNMVTVIQIAHVIYDFHFILT